MWRVFEVNAFQEVFAKSYERPMQEKIKDRPIGEAFDTRLRRRYFIGRTLHCSLKILQRGWSGSHGWRTMNIVFQQQVELKNRRW